MFINQFLIKNLGAKEHFFFEINKYFGEKNKLEQAFKFFIHANFLLKTALIYAQNICICAIKTALLILYCAKSSHYNR